MKREGLVRYKLNINVDTAAKLRARIPCGARSEFVTEAIDFFLANARKWLEQHKLKRPVYWRDRSGRFAGKE